MHQEFLVHHIQYPKQRFLLGRSDRDDSGQGRQEDYLHHLCKYLFLVHHQHRRTIGEDWNAFQDEFFWRNPGMGYEEQLGARFSLEWPGIFLKNKIVILKNNLWFQIITFFAKNVFSPTRSKTTAAIKNCSLWRQANGADVLFKHNWSFKEQQSNVIEKTSLVEFFMDSKINNIMIGMWVKFVFCLCVPFASANFQSLRIFPMYTVSS